VGFSDDFGKHQYNDAEVAAAGRSEGGGFGHALSDEAQA